MSFSVFINLFVHALTSHKMFSLSSITFTLIISLSVLHMTSLTAFVYHFVIIYCFFRQILRTFIMITFCKFCYSRVIGSIVIGLYGHLIIYHSFEKSLLFYPIYRRFTLKSLFPNKPTITNCTTR